MRAYIYVCLHLCMFACVHASMYVCMPVRVYKNERLKCLTHDIKIDVFLKFLIDDLYSCAKHSSFHVAL